MLQCVVGSALCDNVMQCLDGSDEERCPEVQIKAGSAEKFPILVEFERTGGIRTATLQPDKRERHVTCPQTHFWCLHRHYCLPVFVRCNGVYDCPGHEDEVGCDVYTCPGFYRCRASKVCVPATHVCDGWPLCPQQDDELLCSQSCPVQCFCNGLAFFCSQPFAAHQFPHLRYLDGRGSGMDVHQLADNHVLIHLSLARCRIRTVTNFTFHNLHSLDLSDNLLTEVSARQFGHMPQLTVLFLSGNPLTTVFTSPATSDTDLHKISALDLSLVKMLSVDRSLFLTFPSLLFLNLSHSGVELSLWNSSQMSVSSVRQLDLRGCQVSELPRDVLRGFLHLQLLHADNFKLCCPAVLPSGFDLSKCHGISDDVSSCVGLLGVGAYRNVFLVLTTLSWLGNVGSVTVRGCVVGTWRQSCSDVVLTHLSVADLGTGLYLLTVGLADRLLAAHFITQDAAWRTGAVCQLAGVLAVSCRHAATSFIAILSLCRFPALTPRFTLSKVKAMCMAAWTCSSLVAVVPPVSQWNFFGQQALCVPLPHKGNTSLESHYAYGVMVLAPLVVFALCCVCEAISGVCRGAAKHSIINKDTYPDSSHFVVLGSLIAGFLYTVACLLPTHSFTDRQRATHTSLVYFGSVVSCAMNPFLHLYGARVQRSKRIKEERLLRIISRARV